MQTVIIFITDIFIGSQNGSVGNGELAAVPDNPSSISRPSDGQWAPVTFLDFHT